MMRAEAKNKPTDIRLRLFAALVILAAAICVNLILSTIVSRQKCQGPNTKTIMSSSGNHQVLRASERSLFEWPFLMAEAGKKKKKEKSEVVVISVNNAQPKGYGGGGGWPIYVPTCGGAGGGGFGGFGRRRKRRSIATTTTTGDY